MATLITTFTYDPAGNPTQKQESTGTTFFEWDEPGRMSSIEPPTVSQPVTFTYNGDGQRITKQSENGSRRFIYDFKKLLQERDAVSDDLIVGYTNTLDEFGELLNEFDDTSTEYHTFDAQWSTDALLDDNEDVSRRFQYRAFGLEDAQPQPAAGWSDLTVQQWSDMTVQQWSDMPVEGGGGPLGEPTNQTYVGQLGYYRDLETNLYLAGTGSTGGGRYYDPNLGRFISEDPLQEESDQPDNLYRYVNNNPVNQVDPSGQTLFVKGSDALNVVRRSYLNTVAQLVDGEFDHVQISDGRFVVMPTTDALKFVTKSFTSLQSNRSARNRERDLEALKALRSFDVQKEIFQGRGGKLEIRDAEFPRDPADSAEMLELAARMGWNIKFIADFWAEERKTDTEKFLERAAQFAKEFGREFVIAIFESLGLDPTLFFQLLGQLGKAAEQIIDAMRESISRFFETLGEGLVGGFELFFKDLPRILGRAAIGVVLKAIGKGNIPVPQSLSLGSAAGFLLSLLGVTWRWFLKLVRRFGGSRLANLIKKLAENAGVFTPAGLFKLIDTAKEKVTALTTLVPDALKGFLADIPGTIASILPDLAFSLLRKFLGGIPAAIEIAVSVFQTLADPEFGKAILKGIVGVADALRQFKPVAVASTFFGFLVESVPKVLQFLIRLVGSAARKLFTKIGEIIDKLAKLVQSAIEKVVKPIIEFIKKNFKKIFGKEPKEDEAEGAGCAINREGRQGSNSRARSAACFVAGTKVHTDAGNQHIETFQTGERVITFLSADHVPYQPAPHRPINPTNHRRLHLRIDQADGDYADIKLLRSLQWIDEHEARQGGVIRLDLPEMSAVGLAQVLTIESCSAISSANGALVTGTFAHTSGRVFDLKLAGIDEPIGVTAMHPIWSVDRNDWVAASDLRSSETVQLRNGTTTVESVTKRDEFETVYNIEVAGDHVYRVGETGLLVHNISKADCKRDPNKASNPCGLPSNAFCQAHHVIPCEVMKRKLL